MVVGLAFGLLLGTVLGREWDRLELSEGMGWCYPMLTMRSRAALALVRISSGTVIT